MPITFLKTTSIRKERESSARCFKEIFVYIETPKGLYLLLRLLPPIPANIDHLFILFLISRSERKRKTDCVKFYKLWISGGIYFFIYCLCLLHTLFLPHDYLFLESWSSPHTLGSLSLAKLDQTHSRVEIICIVRRIA